MSLLKDYDTVMSIFDDEIKVCSVEYICRASRIDGKVCSDFTVAVLAGPDGRQTVRKGGFWCDPGSYGALRELYVKGTG